MRSFVNSASGLRSSPAVVSPELNRIDLPLEWPEQRNVLDIR
jgi:hypothetical protein